jgi:flagellar motor switch protein FliG
MSILPPNDLVPDASVAPLTTHGTPALSGRRKAAIVVRCLLSQGQHVPLARLPQDLQIALAHELAGMRSIDHQTLDRVVAEFIAGVEGLGLLFPPGVEDALALLDGSISDVVAARLRRDAGLGGGSDPWQQIAEFDSARLLPALESESVEVAAVLLSKLKVSTAAELLGMLPGERARRITYAVSRTGAISPAMVRTIGEALVAQLGTEQASAFADGPVDRVGAILNFAPSSTREDVLSGLDETDVEFAEQVRRAIFTFANIPSRLDARDVPKIIREIDQAALVRAIAAASGDDQPAADFILANMSQRMADSLREEAREIAPMSEPASDAAKAAVVGVIRALEAAGELFLLAEDD